jgi:flagellar biosynthetic protein FliQ
MSELEVLDIARSTLFLILKISAPALLIAMFVGTLISLVQALTQIQEATLSFAPKIIAMFVVLIVCMPRIGQWMNAFAQDMFMRMATVR